MWRCSAEGGRHGHLLMNEGEKCPACEYKNNHPTTLPLGQAVQAIEFALEIDDHFDMREFLDGWMHGDVQDWPEYQTFLEGKLECQK